MVGGASRCNAPPDARWRRLVALLPADPGPRDVAALDHALDQPLGLPAWVRKAPASWRRALLTGQPVPWASLLRVLDLRRLGLRDHDLAAVVQRPELGSIIHLKLYDNAIGTAGLTALVQWSVLGHLDVLNLTHNRIGAAGVRALTETISMPALREVYLVRHRMGDQGAAVVAAAPFVQQFTVLDVRENALSAVGTALLARSPYLQGCAIRGLDPT